MKQYTLRDFAAQIINENGRPMTTFEIWQYGVEKGYDKKGGFIGKTPWVTIGRKLVIDINDNPKTQFVVNEKVRPKTFSLKTLPVAAVVEKKSDIPNKTLGFEEKDLHKHLTYFAFTFLDRVYTKTIRHQLSGKRDRFKEWIHPDLMGVNLPVDSWNKEVMELSKEMGLLPIKLYSFELKKEINSSTLREYFFQAVSNSSWAHEGYLATALMEQDEDFQQELKRLSNSFGIGIIKLDVNHPDDSEVLIPARTREVLDWTTINKLCALNNDVREFIESVMDSAKIRKIHKELFDKVMDSDEISIKL